MEKRDGKELGAVEMRGGGGQVRDGSINYNSLSAAPFSDFFFKTLTGEGHENQHLTKRGGGC